MVLLSFARNRNSTASPDPRETRQPASVFFWARLFTPRGSRRLNLSRVAENQSVYRGEIYDRIFHPDRFARVSIDALRSIRVLPIHSIPSIDLLFTSFLLFPFPRRNVAARAIKLY